MTQDEIIEMARQAGFVEYELDDGTTNAFDKRYEAFATLVAAKEREACAKVADEYMRDCEGRSFGVGIAIRTRGEQA
jgi:hypothetical protein